MSAAIRFKFDEPSHTYTLDGVRLPCVSDILPDIPFGFASVDVLETARERGQRVHEITAAWDHGTLDLDTVEPHLLGYLHAWIKFIETTGAEVTDIERKGFHPVYRYAGTIDRALVWRSDQWTVDIKATAQIYPHGALQTAAYAEMFGPPNRRATVQLRPDGDYQLKEWKDRTDFAVFRSYLNCYLWEQKHHAR